MAMPSDLPSRVLAVIAEELGSQHMQRIRGEITPDSHLGTDVGMSSMDVICVTVALDEAFGIELPDAAVEGWEFVRDVIASVGALAGVRADG